MIEKVIHYCWFGRGEKTALIKKCINSWKKKCPNYKIIEWNESNFNVHMCKFCEQAYNEKKWAFVSDYARMWILYNYGGIYFDTDIELLKNFDELLDDYAFTGFEGKYNNEMILQTGVIACQKKDFLIKKMLDYYETKSLYDSDGTIVMEANVVQFTNIFKNHGLIPLNQEQYVLKWHVYPRTYFTPIDPHGNRDFTKNSYADHHFTSTWEEKEKQGLVALRRSLKYRIKKNSYEKIKIILGPKIVERIKRCRHGK